MDDAIGSPAMAERAKKAATYADLEAVPANLVAEIIEGSLVTHPRPAPRHATAAFSLGDELAGPFQKGRGGPGGWVFMVDPELHFGANVVVPDIAGWRRENLPTLPDTAYLETPPDWVCEMLSPSTEHFDRGAKRRIYADAGVANLCLVDPRVQVLEAFQLVAGQWLLLGAAVGAEEVKLPPFDAAPFSLGLLWPFDAPVDPNAPPSN